MKKQTLLFLVIIFSAIFLIFGSLQYDNKSRTSLLDELFGFILGEESSSKSHSFISCQPDFIIFNISLNKGELYKYKDEYEGTVLNSSYFVKDYNTSTDCYTIEYKTQTIAASSSYHSENSITGENITTRNITISNDNRTFLLCNNKPIKCGGYIYRETLFFGIIDKNLKVIETSKEHVKHRWGIYSFEGDFYPNTTISVDKEERLNNRDVYVVKKVVQRVNGNKKNVSIGILYTSYFWVDKNKGILIKQVDYDSDGNKIREIQLINQ